MKILFIGLLCICQATAFAQIATVLNLNKPSATLSEWARNTSTIVYIATNPDPMPRQVIIRTELKTTDGATVATKDLSQAEVFQLRDGNTIFSAKEVLPLHQMNFSGSYKSTLERTGKLPAGAYLLEVQLLNPTTLAPVSALQTRSFFLTAIQLPNLLMPVDKDSIDVLVASTVITFRWTPVTPRTAEQVYYRLQVFEILPFQQPLQALRGNQPLLDVEVRNQQQYYWRPQLALKTDTLPKKFIWTIQAMNGDRVPMGTDANAEARAEPFMFIIRKK